MERDRFALVDALREVMQESTGFSPNDLVFGHTVRGPLSLLYDQWKEADHPKNLLDHVNDLRHRLYAAGETLPLLVAGRQRNCVTYICENLIMSVRLVSLTLKLSLHRRAHIRRVQWGGGVCGFCSSNCFKVEEKCCSPCNRFS